MSERPHMLILFILIPFISVTLPLCFQNIDYLNLLLAFHVDSGSIISSVFTILDSGQLYNQNIGYHTAYYGFPYNSILILLFGIYRHFLHLNTITNFYIFALTARLISLIIAGGVLVSFYYLSIRVLKNIIVSLLLTIVLAIFYDFIFYSTLIKGDLLALLFSVGSFSLLLTYLERGKILVFKFSALLGALAIFTKQPYIFIAIPLLLGYFFTRNKNSNNLLEYIKKSLYVFIQTLLFILIAYFIIHPYAFIQFNTYLKKQGELRQMVAAPMNENLVFWWYVYLNSPIILIGIVSSFIYSVVFIFIKKRSKETKIVFLISLFCLQYILWLTTSVGPIRVTTYLLPVYPFLLLVSAFVITRVIVLDIVRSKQFFQIGMVILIIMSSFYFLIQYAVDMSAKFSNFRNMSSSLTESPQAKSITKLISDPLFDKKVNKLSIVCTVSIPIPNGKFKKQINNWQFGSESEQVKSNLKAYQPDLLLIDTNQWYERPLKWWRNLAKDIGLKKEKIYYKKNDSELIILFYR